jgi:tetrapyrrole methylase family protein / MazG family protein
LITLIGLGPGDIDTLTRGAERALREAAARHVDGTGALFVRTARHPVVDALVEWGLQFEALDSLYDSLPDFQALYAAIADRVFTAASGGFPVAFAVPGHPLFGEDAVRIIRERAGATDVPVTVVSSGSFVDAALTAAGAFLDAGCDVRDALAIQETDVVDSGGFPGPGRIDSSRGLLLYQIFDADSASHAKLALMRDYPDEWEVVIVRNAAVKGREEVLRVPLFELDRQTIDHLTAVYVPPLPPALRRPGFASLVGIMARLRAPDGCPWDREQTPQTLKRYFIEETYEVIEAIDADDSALLCEELGDALLQIVFHAQLAAEEGVFTIDDVAAGIVEKLIRRHPHVFGDLAVADSAEVLRNWEKIKRAENTEKDADWRTSILDGIPKGLPALMQAAEVSKKVVKVGFEWESFADVLAKLDEEIGELKAELALPEPNAESVADELGDLLFTIVQVARWQKVDAEEALRAMLARFTRRFRHIEDHARKQGRAVADMSLAEMDALWDEAKRLPNAKPDSV